MKLLEIPIEYAVSSINPNGDKNRIVSGGTSARIGAVVTIAAKAKPVDQAEKIPQATPNPGINIGNAIVVLCTKIPNASISNTSSSNSNMKFLASSSLTDVIEPNWYAEAKIAKNMKNVTVRIFFTLSLIMNDI